MGLRISPAGLFLYFSLLIIIMKLLIFSLPVNPSIPSLKERKEDEQYQYLRNESEHRADAGNDTVLNQ